MSGLVRRVRVGLSVLFSTLLIGVVGTSAITPETARDAGVAVSQYAVTSTLTVRSDDKQA